MARKVSIYQVYSEEHPATTDRFFDKHVEAVRYTKQLHRPVMKTVEIELTRAAISEALELVPKRV